MNRKLKHLVAGLSGLLMGFWLMSATAEPVDINLASAETLAENIVGVGPVTAEKIVAYRLEHGDFQSIDELMNVSGIGIKTLEANQDVLMIDGKVLQN
ncbi:MAG: helix-hairpin-helix domain-containing protein [Gammaproteobacteria bacterium]